MQTGNTVKQIITIAVLVGILILAGFILGNKKKEVSNDISAITGVSKASELGLSAVSEENFTDTTKKDETSTSVSIKTSDNCDIKTSFDFTCYQTYFEKLVKEKGTAKAFVELKKEYETNGYIRSQCHPLTHVIGRATASLFPNVVDAYKYGDSICWSGFYHGVMEQIVNQVGMSKLAGNLDSICKDIPGKERYSFDYYNCVHGLGHGLMAITENELFKSLTLCDNLNGGWEKTSCYGGVFMENIIVDNKNHFTKYLKPSEPVYPCNAVEAQYKSSCYLMQTSYMLKVSGNNFSKVFENCRNADEGYIETCYQSLGRDASGQSLSNAESTKAKCDLGSDYAQKSNCIIGAVKDFISYFHSEKEANHFCTILSPDLQKICSDTATSYYASL